MKKKKWWTQCPSWKRLDSGLHENKTPQSSCESHLPSNFPLFQWKLGGECWCSTSGKHFLIGQIPQIFQSLLKFIISLVLLFCDTYMSLPASSQAQFDSKWRFHLLILSVSDSWGILGLVTRAMAMVTWSDIETLPIFHAQHTQHNTFNGKRCFGIQRRGFLHTGVDGSGHCQTLHEWANRDIEAGQWKRKWWWWQCHWWAWMTVDTISRRVDGK